MHHVKWYYCIDIVSSITEIGNIGLTQEIKKPHRQENLFFKNQYRLKLNHKLFCNLKSKIKIKIVLQSSRPCNHHTHQEKPKNIKNKPWYLEKI
jgi:hypothetical protein